MKEPHSIPPTVSNSLIDLITRAEKEIKLKEIKLI
jgi:hypothetical protein